ncbi:TetR/AcrR family transcriptional regulator [Janthinobacterium sp. RB2R34]|uniref:TetR/AcrR family transcriptional regulator n=1 Tax=Janthinobacterium sp. RB2R34 TaxID=3424193 RepID=UPI003F282587
MKAEYTDVRQHILDQGKVIITRKGFAGVGLNEILSAAAVPKGSFYHYFKSKELFGEAMLADYVQGYLADMEVVLTRPGQSAAQSLMDYWATWTSASLDGSGCDCRCLVVKLSSEVADMSEPMRMTLLDGTSRIIARLALAIAQGRVDDSLPSVEDPAHMASTLYQLWLGAAMLTKLRRDDSALKTAWQSTLAMLALPLASEQ